MSNKKTFRLFISSTFSDFKEERKILQTKVFPKIRKYCSEKGYTFHPIDLRWGIKEEAQLDQKTLDICLEEVRTCKSHPHPNFLVMLGDRYGWIPLPYNIEQNEFEEILKFSDNTESSLLNEWYQLDKNQLPTSYILKQREGKFREIENWNIIENIILKILQNNSIKASLTSEQKRKYFTSVTEAEIEEGIISYLQPTAYQKKIISNNLQLEKEDAEYIFGFIRTIKKGSKCSDKFIATDFKKAQELKAKVKNVLLQKNILECNAKQIDENKLDYKYLKIFEKKIIEFLKKKLEIQILKEKKYTELEIEKQEQEYFAIQKRKDFVGQGNILKSIKDYIENDDKQAFILCGRSGSGKSSIIAKSISKIKTDDKIIYRFVGATPNSTSSFSLLKSILSELNIKLENTPKETIEEFSIKAKKHLLLLKNKIVIFIDGIDQLTNVDNFLWLPELLPDNIKIIISALKDKQYPEDSQYFKTLNSISKNTHFVEKFDRPEKLLLRLLEKENRTTQQHQLKYFLIQYNKVKTPLYVYIAAQEIKHWKSYNITPEQKYLEGAKIQRLANTQKGIVNEYISNLSKIFHHDKKFVDKVLSFIYLSTHGLSETELLDLMNTDKKFIKKIAPDTWHKNSTKSLPDVIWARLYTQLKPFLFRRNQDNEELLFFFHREFLDVIKNKSNLIHYHKDMIDSSLKKIKEFQCKNFYENRWGKLYTLLLSNFNKKYKLRKNSKWFNVFLSINNKYTDELLKFSLNQWNTYTNHNNLFLKIAYAISMILYENDNKKWQKSFSFALNDLAYYYSQIGKFNEGLILEKKALRIRETLASTESYWLEEYVTSLSNISQTYSSINDMDKAIKYAGKALKITTENFNKNKLKWLESHIILLVHLSSYYKKIKNPHKSFFYSKKAYDIVLKFYKKDKSIYQELYLNTIREFAESLYNTEDLKKSSKLNLEHLSITESLFKKNKDKWAKHYVMSLNSLATIYEELNNMKLSIKYQTQAFNIANEYYKKQKDFWAYEYLQIINNLNFENPNINIPKVLNNAIEISKKLYKKLPERWIDIYFSVLSNTGNYYVLYGNKIKDAGFFFNRALNIINVFYNKNPKLWVEQYATALQNMASFYLELSNYEKALFYAEKSFKIIEKAFQKYPKRWIKDYILSLSNLAYAYFKNGQLKKSLEYEELNYNILKKRYQENKNLWLSEYISSLINLAFQLKQFNRVEQAVLLEKESLKILRNLVKQDSVSWQKIYINNLINIGYSYTLLNQISKAKYYYRIAIKFIEKELKKESTKQLVEFYIFAINNYADTLSNLKIKLKYYKKSNLIITKQYRINPKAWCSIYLSSISNIAYVYNEMENFNEAIVLNTKSLKIYKKLYNNNNYAWIDEYTMALNNLANNYHLIKDFHQAIKYEKQSLKILETAFKTNPDFWQNYYITALNNIAVSCREIKKYKIAEKYFLTALNILNKKTNVGNAFIENYKLVLHNLLILYQNTNNQQKLNEYFDILDKFNAKYP